MRQPTNKQLRYLFFLLRKQGWDTRYINSDWKKIGFSMRERSGRVEDVSMEQASRAISGLLELQKEGE